MGKKSVLLPFYLDMGLEDYPEKDKNDILKIVVRYLLGCSKFKVAKSKLEPYECYNSFQKVLKSLDLSYQLTYRRSLRKYVQGIDVQIHDFDKFHLERLSTILRGKVKRGKFPLETEAMKSMTPTIRNQLSRLRMNRKLQRMTSCGIDDIKQIMYLRILSAYRTYLPSFGSFLPTRAFFAVLHKALNSSIIDKMREFDTDKSQMTITYAMLGEEFEVNAETALYSKGKMVDSPESILEAKEILCMDIPFKDRIDFAY